MKKFTPLVMSTLFTLLMASTAVTTIAEEPVKFKVSVENISNADGQKASNGSNWPFALSPGLWVVHHENAPLFTTGEKDRGKGIEAQAEDGNPGPLAKTLEGESGIMSIGVFNTPTGATSPGPILPGGKYEFTFTAAPGTKLSLATMFGQSNDLFYAPKDNGIELFDENGMPIGGDITSEIILWDAGTEVNQEPGVGSDQGPRQSAPDTGADENGTVRQIKDVKDGFTYPKTSDVMRVMIMKEDMGTTSSRK